MYAPQSSIDPSLAALLQTAQMLTPDQTPTVAAQVAQAAQQKMQPQGIMQGMQGAKQDYAAAAPSMMRNMQQQQMQQMVKQAMQPQPAGIEGLPAPNMQGMAEGGVVGFAGDGEFGSYVPNATDELRVEEFNRKRQEDYQRQKAANEAYRANIARQKQEEQQREQLEFLETADAPQAAALRQQMEPPQASYSNESRVGLASKPAPVPVKTERPPAPAPRPPAAPAAGIAQLVEPTQDRSKVDTAGASFLEEAKKQETARRKIAADREVAIKGMPDLNEQGIAALKRAEEERRRLLGIDQSDDSRRRWAGIFRGWGGDRDAYDRILTGIANRDAAANQAQLNFDQAQLKLREAQQAKALGQFDRAEKLEAEVAELYDKANKSKLQAQQIEASLASNKYATDASIYNTKVSARERAADRAQQAMIEGARLKQQAEMNGQTKLANQINAANITVSSAIEKMDRDLEKRFGQSNKLFQIMSPEDIQKNPGLAASYQQYQRERENIFKTSVEPAINHRNRLAAMVSGGQDLSKWGELQVNPGR